MERVHKEKPNYQHSSVVRLLCQATTTLARSVSKCISSVVDISKPSETSGVLLDQRSILKMNFVLLNTEYSLWQMNLDFYLLFSPQFGSLSQEKLILFIVCYILGVSLIFKVSSTWIVDSLNCLGLCFAALTSCRVRISLLRLPTPERKHEEEAVWWRPV